MGARLPTLSTSADYLTIIYIFTHIYIHRYGRVDSRHQRHTLSKLQPMSSPFESRVSPARYVAPCYILNFQCGVNVYSYNGGRIQSMSGFALLFNCVRCLLTNRVQPYPTPPHGRRALIQKHWALRNINRRKSVVNQASQTHAAMLEISAN